MKNIKWLIVLFVVLSAFALPHAALCQEDATAKFYRTPLRHIKQVMLNDVSVEDDLAKDGVSANAIQVSVENKLRVAGFHIIPKSLDAIHQPFQTRPQLVTVHIESLKLADQPLYCYSVRFEVMDFVTLVQDKTISLGMPVWEKSTLGYAGTSRLSAIKDSCDNFTDKFVNDWLKAKDETPGAPPKTP